MSVNRYGKQKCSKSDIGFTSYWIEMLGMRFGINLVVSFYKKWKATPKR